MKDLADCRRQRDDELALDGWTRRFIGSPPTLSEHVKLYGDMGLEVLLDPITDDELQDMCQGCTLALSFFRVVYTRRSP